MVVYFDETSSILHYSDNKCYFCGRTPEQVDTELNKILMQHIDSRITEFHRIVEDAIIKSLKIVEIIQNLKSNVHLDFSVKTVETDLNKFNSLIPGLQTLVLFSNNKDEKLHDILERIQNYVDSKNKIRFEVVLKNDVIKKLVKQKLLTDKEYQKYQYFIGLKEKMPYKSSSYVTSVQVKTGDEIKIIVNLDRYSKQQGDLKIKIPICEICSSLIVESVKDCVYSKPAIENPEMERIKERFKSDQPQGFFK